MSSKTLSKIRKQGKVSSFGDLIVSFNQEFTLIKDKAQLQFKIANDFVVITNTISNDQRWNITLDKNLARKAWIIATSDDFSKVSQHG